MNNSLKYIGLTLLLGGGLMAAGPITERARNQQQRIVQGTRSGQLTVAEAARLEAEERRLHRTIVRDRIDGGGLSMAERAKIDHLQDQVSRDIYVQKHDGLRRR